jgi:tetratricopeptide (TPR) repeat protein
MKTSRLRVCIGIGLALIAAAGAAAETIQINRPLLSVPSSDTEEFLDAQIIRAISDAEAQYDGLQVGYRGFSKSVRAQRATITVDVVAAEVPGSTMLVLNAMGPNGASESIAYRMPWHDALYREISQMLGFFNGVLGSGSRTETANLAFLQDFLTDFIDAGDMQFAAGLYPYSLTSRNGNLMIAAGMAIVEVDPFFREQAKYGVDAGLSGAWAMQVGVTPAGTLAVGSLSQGGILRFVPEIPEPFRIPTRSAITGLTVADDGTIYTLDQNQDFLRIATDGIAPLRLDLPEGTWITYMNAGPESTLWLWEPSHRSFFVYDSDGARIDMVLPHLGMDVAMTMKYFQPLESGGIFAAFGDRFVRLNETGAVEWQYMYADIPEITDWLYINQFHYDEQTGMIYALNLMSKYIYQIIDLDHAREAGTLRPEQTAILESNARLQANPYDQQALADRAEIYESIDAWELAAKTWEDAYGLNPMNAAVADAREAVVIQRLEVLAGRLYERTLRLLDQYGVATAAYPYQQAQEVYEDLISRLDDPSQAERELQELRRHHDELQNPTRQRPPLSIDNVAIGDVFPSLFTFYQDGSAGTVTVRNAGNTEVTDVTVRADMRYLEFTTPGSTVNRIGPGESAELAVRLPISDRTLALQESSPVPVNITVGYSAGNQEYEASEVAIITVHRATALTWDDSGKLAAYVTPRDSIVAEYAAPFVGVGDAEQYAVSEKIFRAARISDAVGVSGLEYIEDPQSGITEVLGNPTAIDTVRFPRNTIRVGYGDCDDTTALMCSLFESVGIRTAIMTTPGHVFMAFDTGEPEQNRWLFESETTAAIAYSGTVWLPYETTILQEGFMASWEEGSRLYRRYEPDGQVEFLPVASVRDRFPAIPLEAASFSVTPPPGLLADPFYDQSLQGIRETLYVRTVRNLQNEVRSQNDRRSVRTWNQIGILHGQFNELREAERAFEEAIDIDPDYSASYINLANLSIIQGDGRAAIRWLDEAEEHRSGTVIATLLRAQALYIMGDRSGANDQMVLLAERAPDLAARYPHLSGSSVGRASEAASTPSLPWSLGDE